MAGKKIETCLQAEVVESGVQESGLEEWMAKMKKSPVQMKIMKDLQLSNCPHLETEGTVSKWIDDVMQYVDIFKRKNC